MRIYKKIIIGMVIGMVLLLFLSSIRTVDRNDTVDTVPVLTGDVDLGNRPVVISDFIVEEEEKEIVNEVVKEELLTEAEIDLIIEGIEKYDTGMQIVYDQCLATDSTEDFIVLTYLVNKLDDNIEAVYLYGDIIDITSHNRWFLGIPVVYLYGDIMERLINAGYDNHVRLGPVIEESLNIVQDTTLCLKIVSAFN